MSPQSPLPSGRSNNADDYQQVVLVRVHRLLKLGYERLDRCVYRAADEEEISGDLAHAIDFVLEGRAHDWMDFFSVHNEAPVRDPKRKGKRRRRVDVRIDSAQRRPRTRFAFEAKRLGNAHGVSNYLGKGGLGCFLRGDYARTEHMAGMLGYVQTGEPDGWAERIRQRLDESPRKYRVLAGGNWQHTPLVDGLEHTYCSSHRREQLDTPVDIYHTLLDFS